VVIIYTTDQSSEESSTGGKSPQKNEKKRIFRDALVARKRSRRPARGIKERDSTQTKGVKSNEGVSRDIEGLRGRLGGAMKKPCLGSQRQNSEYELLPSGQGRSYGRKDLKAIEGTKRKSAN